MKILVTGACGYIGCRLVPKLLEDGFEVEILDKMTFGNKISHLKDVNFIKGDIRNMNDLKIIKDMDIVVHLAAVVGDPACNMDISRAYETNVNGTKNIVELMKMFPDKKLLFASSCSVYGKSNGFVNEDSEANPVDYYGMLKLAGENIVKTLKNHVIMRFATLYGLSPRMRFDLVINSFIKNAIKGGKITVFGGHQHRPFIDIETLTDNITLATAWPADTYNLLSKNATILEVAKRIAELTGAEVETSKDITDKRDYGVVSTRLNELGDFDKSLKEQVEKIKENFQDEDTDDKIFYNNRVDCI